MKKQIVVSIVGREVDFEGWRQNSDPVAASQSWAASVPSLHMRDMTNVSLLSGFAFALYMYVIKRLYVFDTRTIRLSIGPESFI